MLNKQTVQIEINLVQTLQQFAQAYEEVSVVRMQRVRSSVLTNRAFSEKLNEIFTDVKSSYRNEILQLMEKNKKKLKNKMSITAKTKTSVNVLVSANTKLHGDIIKKSFNLFVQNSKNASDDLVIVGRVGRDLYEQQASKRFYTYFDLPETNIKTEDIKPLISFLIQYEKVNVFYGRFTNVIQQIPTATNVTGETPLEQALPPEKRVRYFFEPSLERVLLFFENEVFGSLVLQTVHEGELARLASRITAMEDALVNINKTRGLLNAEERRIKRLNQNKKQIESISGIALWSK